MTKFVMHRIKDIAEVKGGKRLPKGEPYSESKTNHPYLRVCDFENRSINLDNLQYITETTHEKIKRYIILKEDIYISIAGTIGVVGIIPEALDGANLTENAAKIVICKPDIVHQGYLVWFLATIGQAAIASKTKATSQPKLALFVSNPRLKPPPLGGQIYLRYSKAVLYGERRNGLPLRKSYSLQDPVSLCFCDEISLSGTQGRCWLEGSRTYPPDVPSLRDRNSEGSGQ